MVATQHAAGSKPFRLTGVSNMFKVADLRNKLLFTLGMILLYRLGSFIPAPGIDLNAVASLKSK